MKQDKYERHVSDLVGQHNIVEGPQPQPATTKQNACAQGDENDRHTPPVEPDGSKHDDDQQDGKNDVGSLQGLGLIKDTPNPTSQADFGSSPQEIILNHLVEWPSAQ